MTAPTQPTLFDTDTPYFNERAEEICNLARATARNIWRIGQILTEVKAAMPHGEFLPWIESKFQWSERSARNFMSVYERFKSATVADLKIQIRALYMLASSTTPDAVVENAVARAEAGEEITLEGAQALKETYEETGAVSDAALATMIDKVRRERRAEKKAKAYEDVPEEEEDEEEPPVVAAKPRRRTAEEIAADKEREALLDRNGEEISNFMRVMDSLEYISQTPLTVAEIAELMRRFDNHNSGWRGHLQKARQTLAALAAEMRDANDDSSGPTLINRDLGSDSAGAGRY